MPARKDIHRILIIGSGPIIIGQACEFDYSGNQAVKALKEEGYEVILVNPNPATVMTTPGLADRIYVEPLTVKYVSQIIADERPDAILSTMGGQTALNLTLDLNKAGVLDKYNVEIIGAKPESIHLAEDRGAFKEIISDLGLESPLSKTVETLEDAMACEKSIGLPLVIRPSFTLGGMGGSIASTHDELKVMAEKALLESPVHQILVEESLVGWKEFELEVMRDKADNAIVVCSIENIDPMGVHTGDSITIAPIQTLSDREYQRMRTASIDILRAIGVDCGGSNVQFAMQPETGRMIVIEMNPRVSRSSALASKATGFPIARCSAKLAVGYTLDEVSNEITGKTASCFEPVLDYCAVKVPRFELEKFPTGYSSLGTQMKSVGEALAMGRTCLEALNKALRASETGFDGLSLLDVNDQELEHILQTAHPHRLLGAFTWLKKHPKGDLEALAQKTGFHIWFLHQLKTLVDLEYKIAFADTLSHELLLEAKQAGLSDMRVASLRAIEESDVLGIRESLDLKPSYHIVDTCAGEMDAKTPYFYSTWGEEDEGTPSGDEGIIILASGPNRIGQGLEFDTCCTLASINLQKEGRKTIMVNSNPETVSTDYNISDRLYLEPLGAESVKAVMAKEKTNKIVVQLGGQTPLNMIEELEEGGAEILGTPSKSIFRAEDRQLFSKAMDKLGLRQPRNRSAVTPLELVSLSKEIGFPVLLRPSFVLGGRSMFIAFSEKELELFLAKGITISRERPVLVDQFLEDAYEYDVDAICDGENVYVGGIMQHIEAAGIHSGDSACVFPPYKSTKEIEQKMIDATAQIAREFGIEGFLNIQFALKDEELYILEVNPRASRTVPFLSKTSGVDLIKAAVKIWSGQSLKEQGLVSSKEGVDVGSCQTGWAVKEAVFSFDRFSGLDPILGPEMKSTGEAIGIGRSYGEAFAKVQSAVGSTLPTEGRVFVSVNEKDKEGVLPIVKDLVSLGFEIAATRGTAEFLFENGIFAEVILKVHEGHPHLGDHLSSGRIDLVINTPLGRFSQINDEYIRTEAVKRKIPYTTTLSAARAAVIGIKYLREESIMVFPLPLSKE